MKRKVIIFSISLLALFLALFLYFLIPIKTPHNLKLPSSNLDEIEKYLEKKDISINFLDKIFINFLSSKPQKGWVYINSKNIPRYKFLIELSSIKNYYVPFTIIPGETSYFVLKKLSKELKLNQIKLSLAYSDLRVFKEGNFIANTYHIPIYYKERDAIRVLLKKSFKVHKKVASKYGLNFKSTIYKKFLIIASIVQKEAANKQEMPLIASVIYNRLKKNMKLQMDGSLNYGKFSHSKITPQKIKSDKSSYNTYKYKGLPKDPVCNVGLDALNAAFNPAKTNYLYFMKKDDKSHYFSSTFKEHLKNIKKRKSEINK